MANWYREVFRRDDPELRAEVGRLVSAARRAPPALEPGAVVEYVRQGELRCGVVRKPPRGRAVDILGPDGGELSVRRDKIAHVSGEHIATGRRGDFLRELARVDGRRDGASRSLDMTTLWEVASEGVDADRDWELDELAALYFGRAPDPAERVALLRALWRGEWFERRGQAWHPMAPARVADRRQERERRRRGAHQRDTLSAWLRRVVDDGPLEPRPPGADEAVALLEQAALYGSEAESAAAAGQLMRGAHLHGPVAALEVLVKLGHWDADENLELRRSGAPLTFAAAAAEAAASAELGQAAWPAAARRSRRVWLGRPVALADADGGCLLAASARRWPGGFLVTVHVPALALLAPPGSQVDEEARTRGVSLRLPDRYLPLVPEPLLAMASLSPQAVVPCVSAEVLLGRDLEVRRCRLRRRRVRVRGVWRDSDGPAAAGTGAGFSGGAGRGAGLLLDLARGLRQRRLDRGAVIFPPRPRPVAEGGAHLLPPPGPVAAAAEEFSLLASHAFALVCRQRGVAAVYRVQPAPRAAVPGGRVLDPVGAHLQARALPRTTFEVGGGKAPPPGSWTGVGLDLSVPGARPADSYLDLVMQRQLLAGLDRAAGMGKEQLRRTVEDTAAAREAAAQIGRAARRYWLLKVLEERGDGPLPALVLERAGLGYVVEVEGLGLRDYVPVRGELAAQPGDRIEVEVEQVSARRDQLRLAPAGSGAGPA